MKYANDLCNQNCGSDRSIIVCQVLVNYVCKGNYGMKIPFDGCDTSGGARGNVFVKYYDDEFCPLYVIKYVSGVFDSYRFDAIKKALPNY